MGQGKTIGMNEAAVMRGAVARLEARGVDRRSALRRVARGHGGTTRYVRAALDVPADWSL